MTKKAKHGTGAPARDTRSERDIQKAIRLQLGQMPDVVLWRNNVGRAGQVEFGLVTGAADLIGIGPGGVFLALEVKTATGRQRPEQRQFQKVVNRYRGVYAVVRNEDQAMAIVLWMRACRAVTP